MSLETRTESLKALLDLYEKIINDHKILKKEFSEKIEENEKLKQEIEKLQKDIHILHNFNDSLMRFGCVKEFIKNNMEIMDELE
jgi:cell division septum initiation protein DivIVA